MPGILEHRVIAVDDGELAPQSWVYVWLRGDEIVHVGSTALPPAVRTFLHLTSEDPDAGRVRTERPEALEGEGRVHAFLLDPGLERRAVRDLLRVLLAGDTPADETPEAETAAEISRRVRQAP